MGAMTGRLRGAIVLAVVLLGVVLAPAALAAGAPLPGRIYDGALTGGAQQLDLALLVDRRGHQVAQFTITYLDLTCGNRTDASLTAPVVSAVAITPRGNFRVSIPTRSAVFENGATSNPVDGRVVITGSFGAKGELAGTLTFAGRRDARGCHVAVDYTGRVRPLVDRFSGTVTQGSTQVPITFLRTEAPHPTVTDFAVGALTVTCPAGGSDQRSFASVDVLKIHAGDAFGGDVSLTDGEAGNIAGTFAGPSEASGTVSYVGRDSCSYAHLPWSARRVATHITGPLTFG
jgi:hypothetical protein